MTNYELMQRYYDRPFACLKLVRDMAADRGLCPSDMPVAAFHRSLLAHHNRVDEPQTGDAILLKEDPLHIGVVVEPPRFIHVFLQGYPVIVDYTTAMYRDRIIGFYRYAG